MHNKMEDIMEKSRNRTPPRWLFTLLAIGGAWASGIYLGKVTITGASTALLLPMIGFAILVVFMSWGALTE